MTNQPNTSVADRCEKKISKSIKIEIPASITWLCDKNLEDTDTSVRSVVN